MFINFSHHPSFSWEQEQLDATTKYGEIVDIPFVNVPPEATEQEVYRIAEEQVEKIAKLAPAAVLCQGEMLLTYYMVNLLKAKGILVVCASTNRISKEVVVNGHIEKRSCFRFVQFRKY